MIFLYNFNESNNTNIPYTLPPNITSFYVNYEQGKLSVFINDENILNTIQAGDSFTLNIHRNREIL